MKITIEKNVIFGEEKSNNKEIQECLIRAGLEKYKDKPFSENASTMAMGIIVIMDLSCSTKIFLTAGSKSQAIEEVLPATKRENNIAIKICLIYCIKNVFNSNYSCFNRYVAKKVFKFI